MSWAVHVARLAGINAYRVLVGKLMAQWNIEDLSINGVIIKEWLAVVNGVMSLRLAYNPTSFLTVWGTFFDVLLTVHLSIFILVITQLDAQNLFYNKFISCLYMFRAPCAHRQEVKIVLYGLCTGRPPTGLMIPDGVQYNFDLLTMSTWCSKHVEAWNKLIVKQILCIKLGNY